MFKRLLLPLAVLVALLPGAPALANTGGFPDSASDPGPMDIHKVTVRNEKRLTIRVTVDNLEKKSGRSASARIDTNLKMAGPEFVIYTGLWDTDWQIVRMKDWKPIGGPLPCPIDQGLNFDGNVIRWTTGPGCLGRYGSVRVSATTQWTDTTDHSPGAKSFHPWVKRY